MQKIFFRFFCCHSATNLSECLYLLVFEGWQIRKFAATTATIPFEGEEVIGEVVIYIKKW